MTCLHLVSSKDQGRFLNSRVCHYNTLCLYDFCSVREFMSFTSDVLVNRTQIGQRQTVKEQGL